MALQRKTERNMPEARESPLFTLPSFPFWRPVDELFRDAWGRRMVSVEEFTDDGTLIVRAEMPGIDPEKDVTITVSDGMLHITAERSEEQEKSGRTFHRREFRYGSLARSVPVPDGVDEDKVEASYKDGILEVRVPLPEAKVASTAHRIPVTRR